MIPNMTPLSFHETVPLKLSYYGVLVFEAGKTLEATTQPSLIANETHLN